MRIYLDNCCYNRPFDDQRQLPVRVETMAKVGVQLLMWTGKIEYAWSDVLDYEVSRSPHLDRIELILPWRKRAAQIVYVNDSVIKRGEIIQQCGIKEMDSLHIACAERAGCDWFLTTDKGILKKAAMSTTLRIANPIQFVTETYQ